ncbi:Ribonuclease H-like superfamily [Sesbania bispinosa]|nr:Ribonuclease H-like superfamily [Sesbania bispinosa]
MGSIAFVARDAFGFLITGHAKKFPASSLLIAEALTLREAVMAAYNLGWSRVILESDCLIFTEACRKEKLIVEIQLIVADIHTVAEGFLHCGFTWIQRTGNEVAHHVAKAYLSASLPLTWISSHPVWLHGLLLCDRMVGSRVAFCPEDCPPPLENHPSHDPSSHRSRRSRI